MKYRKKPVVIEAWRWLFNNKQEPEPTWVKNALSSWPAIGSINFEPDHGDGPRICIATLSGVVTIYPGDWIIKGVIGEVYPCKPDIFEKTYEPIT